VEGWLKKKNDPRIEKEEMGRRRSQRPIPGFR
jgi:hypothetical protein